MEFKINFELNDKKKLFEYWDDIIKNNIWSHGKYTELFEDKWSKFNDLYSLSFSSWSGAAEAVINYFKLSNETVLCPSNTFQATPMVSLNNGCKIKFVDCFCIAFTILGWQCPVLVTPIPLVKSIYLLLF